MIYAYFLRSSFNDRWLRWLIFDLQTPRLRSELRRFGVESILVSVMEAVLTLSPCRAMPCGAVRCSPRDQRASSDICETRDASASASASAYTPYSYSYSYTPRQGIILNYVCPRLPPPLILSSLGISFEGAHLLVRCIFCYGLTFGEKRREEKRRPGPCRTDRPARHAFFTFFVRLFFLTSSNQLFSVCYLHPKKILLFNRHNTSGLDRNSIFGH